jgi:hypothetical protein
MHPGEGGWVNVAGDTGVDADHGDGTNGDANTQDGGDANTLDEGVKRLPPSPPWLRSLPLMLMLVLVLGLGLGLGLKIPGLSERPWLGLSAKIRVSSSSSSPPTPLPSPLSSSLGANFRASEKGTGENSGVPKRAPSIGEQQALALSLLISLLLLVLVGLLLELVLVGLKVLVLRVFVLRAFVLRAYALRAFMHSRSRRSAEEEWQRCGGGLSEWRRGLRAGGLRSKPRLLGQTPWFSLSRSPPFDSGARSFIAFFFATGASASLRPLGSPPTAFLRASACWLKVPMGERACRRFTGTFICRGSRRCSLFPSCLNFRSKVAFHRFLIALSVLHINIRDRVKANKNIACCQQQATHLPFKSFANSLHRLVLSPLRSHSV